jgi:hypothetical protein
MASEYKPNFGVLTLTANTTVSADAYAGRTIRLAAAAGLTVTLPPATGSGARYEFIVGTSVTSNQYRINAAGTDKIGGVALNIASASTGFKADPATDGRINMNGTTTGGLIGTRVELIDGASGLWTATVHAAGSSTGATPFAANA